MQGVAFLLGNLTDGGSETKTVKLANRLSKTDCDVHLIYLGAPHTLLEAIEDSVTVKFLDRRGKFSFRALRELKSYVDQNHIESLFCINYYPLVYGWPVCRGNARRRCIAAVNTYETASLRDRLFMLIYAYILRRCDLVIFGSEAQRRLWLRKYRLSPQKCTLVYNGVDAEYFTESLQSSESTASLRASLGVDEDTIVIGCVAHLRPEKSHEDLLAAMKCLAEPSNPKAVLLLVGDGPEDRKLRVYAEDNGLSERVRFCGRASDVRPYLELFDIFVLPSSTEVFSNAILEAMVVGLPVVCSAVGGSVEMVVDGETGITYERRDVASLVEALRVLMADRDKRENFGRRGAMRAREEFSIERMDFKYAEVISGSSSQKSPT